MHHIITNLNDNLIIHSPKAPAMNWTAAMCTAPAWAAVETFPGPSPALPIILRLPNSARMCTKPLDRTSSRVQVQCGCAAPGRYILAAGWTWWGRWVTPDSRAQVEMGHAGEATTAEDAVVPKAPLIAGIPPSATRYFSPFLPSRLKTPDTVLTPTLERQFLVNNTHMEFFSNKISLTPAGGKCPLQIQHNICF